MCGIFTVVIHLCLSMFQSANVSVWQSFGCRSLSLSTFFSSFRTLYFHVRKHFIFRSMHVCKRIRLFKWCTYTVCSSLWKGTWAPGLGPCSRTSYHEIPWSHRSREFRVKTFLVALIFSRHLDSSAADMPAKFQSDTIVMISNLASQRIHKIGGKMFYRLVNRGLKVGWIGCYFYRLT